MFVVYFLNVTACCCLFPTVVNNSSLALNSLKLFRSRRISGYEMTPRRGLFGSPGDVFESGVSYLEVMCLKVVRLTWK